MKQDALRRVRAKRAANSGRIAEDAAAKLLQDNGLRLLVRNFSCKLGEIDLIMLDNQCVVFVEVRSRSRPSWGDAAATIDARKQARLRRAAELFLRVHPDLGRRRCRFDAVCFDNGLPRWIRQAFDG